MGWAGGQRACVWGGLAGGGCVWGGPALLSELLGAERLGWEVQSSSSLPGEWRRGY